MYAIRSYYDLAKIKALAKAHGRGKEDLPPDPVAAQVGGFIQLAVHQQEVGDLVGEEQGGQQYAGQDAESQIVGEYHYHDSGQHHTTR